VARRKKTGTCAYCGEFLEITRDHIPPKSLFGRPHPSNLITVPACRPCHEECKKDDEYFHFAITVGVDREKFPKENAASVDTINNLVRPESTGFANLVKENYDCETKCQTIDGIRINAVLHRIVRGLFFYQTRIHLPKSVPFKCYSISDSPRSADLSKIIDNAIPNLQTIGDGVFRYAFLDPQTDRLEVFCLLKFYDHRIFWCEASAE
jgi:hypothetical protein